MLAKILKSTNGTLNLILLGLLAVAAFFSFPEQPLENLFVAAVAFMAAVRGWAKDGIKFSYNANGVAYLFTIGLMLFPYLDKLFPALQSFIDALVDGKTEKILAAVFVVLNEVWQLFQKKPWKEPTPTA